MSGTSPVVHGNWTKALLYLLERADVGRIDVIVPGGRRHSFGNPGLGPLAELELRNETVARSLLVGGDVAFAEAFMDGDWESPDPAAVIEYAARNADAIDKHLGETVWGGLLRRALHVFHANTRFGSKRNISYHYSYHYDLGNEFYRLWLDPTMTYSSALFEREDASLEDAQRAKYRRLVNLLGLESGQSVLEIGCGWGGFAVTAAGEKDCRVTGLTLSERQRDFAARRAVEAGLGDRIDIRLEDYRDTRGMYDRIASIEMFEAVGERYWPVFFDRVRERLARGGLAAMQIITIADERFEAYRARPDFIQRYIFPGGMLPTLTHLRSLATDARMEWMGDHGFGQDYARTLRLWRQRFVEAWPEISRLGFDERFKRMWQYYLAYCEGGFRAGSIDVRQIVIQRG
ncbi:MAG: class I SAM-dependent methyltransferase [Alphaproteobacteria bacterium]|nr:class I SAM-dependent methyltransferase [Alphaproteobacteria bacterium]